MMTYHKILFATDFSPASEAALEHAGAIARDSGATLLIVHVEEIPALYPGGEMVFLQPDAPNAVVRRMLDDVPAPAGVRCERLLTMGVPAEDIVKLADEHRADLIVIGTHGRTGLARVLMGSVAELVMRRAHCPVLTVKAPQHLTHTVEHTEAASK